MSGNRNEILVKALGNNFAFRLSEKRVLDFMVKANFSQNLLQQVNVVGMGRSSGTTSPSCRCQRHIQCNRPILRDEQRHCCPQMFGNTDSESDEEQRSTPHRTFKTLLIASYAY